MATWQGCSVPQISIFLDWRKCCTIWTMELFNPTANSSQIVPVRIQAALDISTSQLVPETFETFSSNCPACGFSSDDLHLHVTYFAQAEVPTYRDDHPLTILDIGKCGPALRTHIYHVITPLSSFVHSQSQPNCVVVTGTYKTLGKASV